MRPEGRSCRISPIPVNRPNLCGSHKPGVTRGNHYHRTKTEKFLVLQGEGIIRFRHIESDEIIEYRVQGEDYRVVDIPPGYTHSIENVGENDS